MNDPTRGLRRRAAAAGDALARAGLSRPIEAPHRTVRALLSGDRDPDLSGKLVVVTGASSGIGEATAHRFASAGATVVIVARRLPELQRVADAIAAAGGEAIAMQGDVSDTDQMTALGQEIVAEHGPVAVLINNAGRSIRRSITESYDRLHDFERTMAVNYFGPVALSLAILPSMVEAGSGRVVNVSTWGTRIPSPLFAAYTASKAAIDAFGRSASADLSGTGVTVASVHMPLVRTPMIAPAQKDYRGVPSLSADEAAGLIFRAAAGKSARVEPAFVTAVAIGDAVAGPVVERVVGKDAVNAMGKQG
jgi:NAD(P)-dependent dehydrogenase (short-subunit alcohol dehydrogenase family)